MQKTMNDVINGEEENPDWFVLEKFENFFDPYIPDRIVYSITDNYDSSCILITGFNAPKNTQLLPEFWKEVDDGKILPKFIISLKHNGSFLINLETKVFEGDVNHVDLIIEDFAKVHFNSIDNELCNM